MYCSNCGQAIAEGARFCAGCGGPVAAAPPLAAETRRCASCGGPLMADGLFCGQCGTRTGVPIAAANATNPGSLAQSPAQPTREIPTPALAASPIVAPSPPALSLHLAGFWPRFGAFLVDSLIVLTIAVGPAILVGFLTWQATYPHDQLVVTKEQADDIQGGATMAGIGVCWAVWAVYSLLGWAKGSTWGMRATGLRLARLSSADAPGFGGALVRVLIAVLGGSVLLGYLWMLWDDQKQTWHDKAAGTVVVARS